MNVILAIDAATGPCSAAVFKNGRITAYREEQTPVMQSAKLLPMIEAVLAESSTTYQELSSIACSVGPGSFTGIRVALASARGIGLAAGKPVHGFTTLQILAFAVRNESEQVLTILNAGKGEVYFQSFATAPLKALSAPILAAPAIITPHPSAFIAGNIALDGTSANGKHFPRADALAELAATHPEWAMLPAPFYIRAPDAKLPSRSAL